MIHKLKLALKKEFIYYLITLVVLALLIHSDLLSDPAARLETMKEKENYLHPFLYSFFVYFVMLVLRSIINIVSKFFEKKSA